MPNPIDIRLSEGLLGFFGATPVARQSVADPSAVTCTTGTFLTTEFVTASTNAATVVSAMANDIVALRAKLLEVTNALQTLGLTK